MNFVIITGLSGAGKSVGMKAFEDMGYYCIDNIPPALIPKFVELLYYTSTIENVALVTDIRGGVFFDDIISSIEYLNNRELKSKILFLEASDDKLIERYKETRRSHPLSPEGRIIDGIKLEREKLSEIKAMADVILDSSSMNIWDLKKNITETFTGEVTEQKITVNVVSFGFKKGILTDADLVFDVRFLPNPYYIEELRELTGNDKEIQNYVMKYPEAKEFFKKIKDLVDFLLPYYVREGKSQLVIGFGCTGGRHRSVTMANKLYDYISKQDYITSVTHRDTK